MKTIIMLTGWLLLSLSAWADAAGDYRGDERCPSLQEWSSYSEPYEPLDHPDEYPTFHKADWPGWACSYQREDGVIVQYGDARSPQEQWRAVWGGSDKLGE